MLELPITEARHQLTSMPRRLARSTGTVAITRRGKRVLAILPWEAYESLMETMEILEDEDLMKVLREDIKALKQGKKIKTIPLAHIEKELGL